MPLQSLRRRSADDRQRATNIRREGEREREGERGRTTELLSLKRRRATRSWTLSFASATVTANRGNLGEKGEGNDRRNRRRRREADSQPGDFVFLEVFYALRLVHVEDLVLEDAAEGDQDRARVVLIDPFFDFD